ncbi:MAG TPA: hypothetical protein VJU59_38325 [Paraburkholderia sp.]|uniref:hypothetical protein n=1 Tax=Paraburkholderia sp. TaxID=1926495 RepID=UPI002B470DD0|nr:hypothetical protein [Paraburkholderia sp.]HKR45466.1 hypothetical protein [Paraburkholderia sp.]
MTSIGFVFFIVGLFGDWTLFTANPMTWKESTWSDIWTVLWLAGMCLLIAGIARALWNMMP